MYTDDRILNIAYSKLFDLTNPWNSAENFETACKLGFDGIKGDVTPSADGRLIMCHDSYFYFDEEGRVLEPGNKGACKKFIKSMTSKKCRELEYATKEARESLGYYAKVADLEDFMKICAKYNKIAYITVRDKQIKMCVDEVYRLIEKYNMKDKCIINSFSMETLSAMRKKDSNICLSLVFGPNRCLTKAHINKAVCLGNCAVCVFWARDVLLGGDMLQKSKKAMAYAKEKGVKLYLAYAYDAETHKFGLDCGFDGFQCSASTAIK